MDLPLAGFYQFEGSRSPLGMADVEVANSYKCPLGSGS